MIDASDTLSDHPALVRSLAVTYRRGHGIHTHRHRWAQLIYARSGLIVVSCANQRFVVPPSRAIWIPPETDHAIAFHGEAALRTLYLRSDMAAQLARPIGGLEVDALLRALIVEIVRIESLTETSPEQQRLALVLLDRLRSALPAPDLLPLPTDSRARRFAERLLASDGETVDLTHLASECGASLRTLQRLCRAELGITLRSFITQARLLAAATLLADGATITAAAQLSGYVSNSAFIAAFKRQFGVTPGHFTRLDT